MKFTPKGIIPALVTPFRESDEIDRNGVRWLVRNAIEGGVDAIIVVGSLGEFPCLSDHERKIVIQTAVDEANGNVPVICGVGIGSTSISVSLTREASDLGVDAIEALPPYYYNIGDEAVVAHYEEIACVSNVPVVIYNFPNATKVNMSPGLVRRLAEIDNIVGIKNSVDSLMHPRQIIRSTRNLKKPFAVLSGLEDYLLPGLMMGAPGTVSGLSNFVPRSLVEIYSLFMDGKIKEASDLFNRVIIPLKELAPPPEPIGALKTGASLFGPIGTTVRLPLLDSPKETRELMRQFLTKEGLLRQEQAAEPKVRVSS